MNGCEIGISSGIRATSIKQRPIVWLNLVCLDAPLVAITWQWLFARSFHIDLAGSARAALFLTAWLIYLIDRLADSLSLHVASSRSLRQEFCSRHAKLWIGITLTVALLDAIIVLSRLEQSLLLFGAFLGGGAFFYLMLNYAFSRVWKTIPFKEIVIGFLFAAGTLLILVPRLLLPTSAMERSTIAFAAFLFAALCSLNCMSIAAWERDLDCSQGKHSIATRCPSVAVWVCRSCFLLAACSLILAAITRVLLPVGMCLAMSAVLLALLHSMSIQRDERTALADLVLLSPALPFFIEVFL